MSISHGNSLSPDPADQANRPTDAFAGTSPVLSAGAAARANLVGRLILWSASVFLVSFALATLVIIIWLVFTPSWVWFAHLFRAVLWTVFGSGLALFGSLFILHRFLVPTRDFAYSSLRGARIHVGLTAWNDEEAIAQSVREFKRCPDVHKVIVVDNNSKDNTRQAAIDAGADLVVTEMVPGYGSCCMRTLKESAEGADVIVLCEGDMTFAAEDVKKFIAYLENCDLVLGTRATQELRATDTQMDWLINPANQIWAKLVQLRFWGTRLTDMGCTYRAIRADAYRQIAGALSVQGNHFSPHMFIEALKRRMRVIEIPVVFRSRVGESKGVGSNKIKAAKVALNMLKLIFRA